MIRSIARVSTLLFVLSISAGYVSAGTLHVIALRHRPAAELQPLIQPFLQGDEAVAASGYQLILRASEARRREIERLIARLDVAARQLTLTLRQGVAHDDRQARDAARAAIGIGNNGHIVIGPGTSIRSATRERSQTTLEYRGERRLSSSNEMHTQILRVQDGQHAFIRMGQSVPVVERVLILTGRRAAVAARAIPVEDFTTGFDVLPRVHGDTVELEITPRLASAQADGNFRFQELQTTVTARLGEWIDLGALMSQSSAVNRAILESDRTQSGERVVFQLKVD